MVAHPNRSGNSAARNPSPAEIAALRERHGLDVGGLARLMFATRAYVERCESAQARLHPAAWTLALLRLGELELDNLT